MYNKICEISKVSNKTKHIIHVNTYLLHEKTKRKLIVH